MSESLVFNLIGNDRLSPVLDHAGDEAGQMARRIDRASSSSSASLGRMVRDSNGRLRDLRGRFVATGQAAQQMGQDAGQMAAQVDNATARADASLAGMVRDSNGRLRDLHGRYVATGQAAVRMGQAVDRSSRRSRRGLRGLSRAARITGSALMGFLPTLVQNGAALKGVGIAAGVVAAPALGALIPILAGAGAAAFTAKLAFGGVSDAVALAGKDQEAYADALKKMSKPQREFTKEVVKTKEGFHDFGREIQKLVLPSFTEALQDAAPAIKVVKGGIKEMAGVFADFGETFGKLLGSGRFRSALQKNFDLGAGFFRRLIDPLADFTQSLLDFGAASKPIIKALGSGFGDLLSKGLPGFFEGLSSGARGTAAFFDGLFGAINRLLPPLGQLIGAVADELGPVFKELFGLWGREGATEATLLTKAIRALHPVFNDLRFAVRSVKQLFDIFAPAIRDTAGAIIDALVPSFGDVDKAAGPFQRLSHWIRDNKQQISDLAYQFGSSMIEILADVIEATPKVIGMFRSMSVFVLDALGGILTGAVHAFGWIPGIGPKLKTAQREFNGFKDAWLLGLDAAQRKSQEFADVVGPRLRKNKLKMNITEWNRKIKQAERQLKNADSEKTAKLKGDIREWKRKVRDAEHQLKTMKDDKTAKLKGDKRDFDSKYRSVQRKHLSSKTAKLRANSSPFWRTVGRIAGRVVTSAVVNLIPGMSSLRRLLHLSRGGLVPRFADGGPVQAFPGGGLVRGPGTDTSDSVFARVSANEFIVRARSVRKYGRAFLEDLNAGRLRAPARRRLPTASASRAGAAAAAGGTTVVNLAVNGALDPVAVAKQIRKVLIELKRTYGSNIQLGIE